MNQPTYILIQRVRTSFSGMTAGEISDAISYSHSHVRSALNWMEMNGMITKHGVPPATWS